MKIFIMTDMEGVCGMMNFTDWTFPDGRYYEEGKKLLTLEVNAAVEGFFSAGATEICVFDGHGFGGINQLYLDRRTTLISAFSEKWPLLLDKTVDAVAWIGQHAKAGTEYSHLAHTQCFDLLDYRINDISVGEFGQLSMCAASLGIYSIFGSGDETFAIEARDLIKGFEAVAVKRGTAPGSGNELDCEGYSNKYLSAVHMHPEKARSLIKSGAEKALMKFTDCKDSFQLLDLKPPFRIEASYRTNGDVPGYKAYAEHPDNLILCMNSPEVKY